MQQLLAAVAEPRRQAILKLVWDREMSAGDIHSHFDVTFGAVSQHLKVLKDVGAVSVAKRGRQRFYRADKAALGPIAQHLELLWHHKLDRLKRLVEAEENLQ